MSIYNIYLFIWITNCYLAVGLASEGVSSGYESMRCESSNNLNAISDLDSQRGKSKTTKKDKKGVDFGVFLIISYIYHKL